MTPKIQALYSAPQLAELLGQSRQVVYHLIDRLGIPWVRVGRRKFVAIADLCRKIPGMRESIKIATRAKKDSAKKNLDT